jgi:hypothetical protein
MLNEGNLDKKAKMKKKAIGRETLTQHSEKQESASSTYTLPDHHQHTIRPCSIKGCLIFTSTPSGHAASRAA